MTDSSQGYGPPKVEGARAVRLDAAERSLAAPSSADSPAPRLRLEIRGEGFPIRSMPLLIKIGGRAHLVSDISADGKTIACLLDEVPEEGAVIEVGYPPHQMAELPERFSLAMIDPGGDA